MCSFGFLFRSAQQKPQGSSPIHCPCFIGRYCNDVWAIDLDTMTWHNPTCSGRAPGPRYGHTATVVDYKIYIFGGRGPSGLLYNDLWCLDVETWKWTLMPSTTAPPLARAGHSAAAVGNKLAFFGGWDGSAVFNDLWVYDIAGRTWLKPKVRGMLPRPRHGHSMVLTPAGRLIVFGGWAQSDKGVPQYLNDTRVFDTGSMMWIRPRIVGEQPPHSYWHNAVMVGKHMVVLGGYGGNKPKPAAAAAEAAMVQETSQEQRGIQVVPETLDDCPPPVSTAIGADGSEVPVGKHPWVWVLDTDALAEQEGKSLTGPGSTITPNKRSTSEPALTMSWFQPFIAGQPAGKRYGHSLVSVGPHILAIAGWDGNKAVAEVLQLDLTSLVGPALLMGVAEGEAGAEASESSDNYA